MLQVWIDITDQPLNASEVHSFLYESNGGGVCVFAGVTRLETNGKISTSLSYEAYKSMALKEIRRLADEASQRWPILRAVVLHRIGTVVVGEPSVLIGVATAHRGPAFEATRFLIDELKKSVQIWKKESFEDGSQEWVAASWQDLD